VRIIAGTAKGRTLKLPKSDAVRPTADRVKETIFNVLGQWLDGETVLDLYAGAGGLGLEALSRGAGRAVFVERDKTVMATLAENIRALGFEAQATTLFKPVDRAVRWLAGQGQTFSLVFSDPPYADEAAASVLEELENGGFVSEGGRVVIEHAKREDPPEKVGSFERTDQRKFGDTVVTFYVRRGSSTSEGEAVPS
jgi:16S rRNA (guanine(966)-N(2))-methyltransferase RsmD